MQPEPSVPQLLNEGATQASVALQQPDGQETESQTHPLERQRC